MIFNRNWIVLYYFHIKINFSMIFTHLLIARDEKNFMATFGGRLGAMAGSRCKCVASPLDFRYLSFCSTSCWPPHFLPERSWSWTRWDANRVYLNGGRYCRRRKRRERRKKQKRRKEVWTCWSWGPPLSTVSSDWSGLRLIFWGHCWKTRWAHRPLLNLSPFPRNFHIKDLHEQLGKTVEAGVNVTRGLVAAKIGAVKSTAELVSWLLTEKCATSVLDTASDRGQAVHTGGL